MIISTTFPVRPHYPQDPDLEAQDLFGGDVGEEHVVGDPERVADEDEDRLDGVDGQVVAQRARGRREPGVPTLEEYLRHMLTHPVQVLVQILCCSTLS